MKTKQAPRIEIHSQLSAFYSKVFSMEFNLTPHHISLYVFLLNQNNRSYWVEWFKLPFDLAMQGAGLGSKKTYYKVLQDLCDWGFLEHQKGENSWKAAKVKIISLRCKNEPQVVPQCEPLIEPQVVPQESKSPELRCKNEPQSELLPTPQGGTYIRHNNIQHINTLLEKKYEKILSEINFTLNDDLKSIFQAIIPELKNKKNSGGGENSHPEYKECQRVYFDFFKSKTGVEPNWKAKDGAALKSLIQYFDRVKKEGQSVTNCFVQLFDNWHKLAEFEAKQIDLCKINGNINTLTMQIKGSGKFQNGTSQHHLRNDSGVLDVSAEHNRKGMERLGMIPKTAEA